MNERFLASIPEEGIYPEQHYYLSADGQRLRRVSIMTDREKNLETVFSRIKTRQELNWAGGYRLTGITGWWKKEGRKRWIEKS